VISEGALMEDDMRIRVGLAVISVSLLVSGCAFVADEPTDPTAAFCDAIADYAGAVLDLRSLDDQATIDDYQAAADAVQSAFADVVAAGVESGEAKLDELKAATDALMSTVRDLPQDVPIADIQAQLQDQVSDIARARAALGVAVCVPNASDSPSPGAS
jgi:hypothetical protein